ncbi:glycosyl hydrolase family 81 [Fusarium phyllophilum]|uniref:glucan endo-1,3-beta-D-glucosidase n=1 Tax=Fusarium phyllophilum TaxID=47803 RepID=A0A8H5MQZ9_9HYPO|nr:glycosyl hydrolase family 81 [Fusarium phyllophilum]
MFRDSLIIAFLLFKVIHASRHHYGLNEGALKRSSDDIFVEISHDPPILVPSRADHPQMLVGVDNKNNPIQTNKFYANFFANNQDNATWTHPYSVWWSSDPAKQGHGLSISHTDRHDFIYGPGDPVKSFEGPAFRQSIALSARELQNGTVLTTDSLTAFSVNVNLAPRRGAKPLISFPLVQGMAFVTVFSTITDLRLSAVSPGPSVYGRSVQLGDGSSWLIYITPACLSEKPTLYITDKGTILGPRNFTGTVQVAKNPAGAAGIDVFNKAAGVYPVGARISGTVSGRTGTYTLAWKKKGIEQRTLLMFALPHHVESFNTETAKGLTSIRLASTTKGIATAILADEFTMVEYELPTDIGFDPWSPHLGSVGSQGFAAIVHHDAKVAIIKAAKVELARDITKLTNPTSKYYGGIAFSVYARAIYAVHRIAGDTSLTASSLANLEAAFDRYVDNQEPNPLCYDGVWKGLVSSASYGNNDSSIDFDNTYYNDHNFHYGYYVYTAAIIAHFDPSWLSKNGGVNKIWVNNLIRDWSNPSAEDPFFPFSRSFDWFHGHSWARGILEAPDGKDQESSAEDALSTYAIKMWGKVIGDANLEAHGNLQLAVTARSLQSYFLLASDNDVQPANFIGNRATGILWDRKVNHTTYFGDEIAFIQGIHMLPIVPSSAYIRKPFFVREEWDQDFAGNKSGSLSSGGFAGHIYANLAVADKAGAIESHAFFRKQTADSPYLSGSSLTWDLAYTAALGGSLASNVSVNSTRLLT